MFARKPYCLRGRGKYARIVLKSSEQQFEVAVAFGISLLLECLRDVCVGYSRLSYVARVNFSVPLSHDASSPTVIFVTRFATFRVSEEGQLLFDNHRINLTSTDGENTDAPKMDSGFWSLQLQLFMMCS